MESTKINATLDQIEALKESVIWNDITRELEAWKKGFAMEQDAIVDDAATENPSTASVLLHMGDLNGRRKAVDYVLSILDVFIDIKKAEIEERKLDKEVSDE